MMRSSSRTLICLLSLQQQQQQQEGRPLSRYRKELYDVWKWKDSVLGDGRDYFIPKPQTLKKLQSVLMKRIPSIQECSILSNCARFEILLVCSVDSSDITKQVSETIMAQVVEHERRKTNKNRWQDQLLGSSALDRPSLIHDELNDDQSLPVLDSDCWDCFNTVETMTRHLCVVAAGMASRPSRPNRPVEFRPFSSRDAHIMLQLKRTVEIVSSNNTKPKHRRVDSSGGKNKEEHHQSSSFQILTTILQTALRAGKACRNVQVVPEIEMIRPGKGFTSRDSHSAKEAAMDKAIEPAVQQCLEKIALVLEEAPRHHHPTALQQTSTNEAGQSRPATATTTSERIQELRSTVLQWSTSPEETVFLKRQLHEPTMALRRHATSALAAKDSDESSNLTSQHSPSILLVDTILKRLREQLELYRANLL